MIALINDTGIVVMLVAVVLLFGASRIPKLARNLGEASKEFKRAQDEAGSTPHPTVPEHALPVTTESGTVTLTREQFDALIAPPSQPATERPALAD